MSSLDRFQKLAKRLEASHLLIQIDDNRVLVRKNLNLEQIKLAALPERNIPSDQANVWFIWYENQRVQENQTVGEFWQQKTSSQEALLQFNIRHIHTPSVRLVLTERQSQQKFTFKVFPQRIGRSEVSRQANLPKITFGIEERFDKAAASAISRYHADIDLSGNILIFRCRSQTQGQTRINDEVLAYDETRELQMGQILRLGELEFQVTSLSIQVETV